MQVAFNPKENQTFTSVSLDCTVKVSSNNVNTLWFAISFDYWHSPFIFFLTDVES